MENTAKIEKHGMKSVPNSCIYSGIMQTIFSQILTIDTP